VPFEKIFYFLTLAAALGSGLIAGVFFIFSVAIMRALERIPNGAAAMQSINVVIINPLFLGVFMGTAVLSLVLAIGTALRWDARGSMWIICAAVVYLIGSIGVTMAFNVPMNNALAAADPATANGHEVWKDYLANWTFWNHVRTIASLGASASFIIGLTLEL
jgi:uncharacterized membrane protein